MAELNTNLANASLPKSFTGVKHGVAVEGVYGLLGPPLYIIVVPNGDLGPYQQFADKDVSLAHVKELCTTNRHISLCYSEVRVGRLPYYLYYVNITGAFVAKFDGPVRMD